MRPLKRKTLKKFEEKLSVPDIRRFMQFQLLEAFGEYCSYCEMPIGQLKIEHHRHHKQWRENIQSRDWNHLLLICNDCRRHLTKRKLNASEVDNYLWPDKDLTFSLHSGFSPFVYEKILIDYKIKEGRRIKSREKQNFIAIKPNPKVKAALRKKAQRTIDLFQLNTPYFSQKTQTISIPFTDHLSLTDHRAMNRLKTWNIAKETLGNYKNVLLQDSLLKGNPELKDQFENLISETAKAKGNWSIWMTVFWNEFKDKKLINDLFVEKPNKASKQLHFLGTNKDMLKYE